MKVRVFAGSFLTAAVLTAVCGCSPSSGSSASGASTTAAASIATASASAAAPAAATSATGGAQAAGPQSCPSSALRIGTNPGAGMAMDGDQWNLTYTNTGTVTCTLYGYPGVSFLTVGRVAVTAPAARAKALPDVPHTVVLAPGQVASDQLETPNTPNLPSSQCHVTVAKLLKVYPPAETVPVFVPFSIAVCAGRAPGAQVWPIVAGSQASGES